MDDQPESQGEQRPDYEATRGSYWHAIEHKRAWMIAGGALLALVVIGAVLAVSANRPPADDSAGETSRTIIPAEPTSEPTRTVPSVTATPTPTEPAASDGAAVGVPAPGRAAVVAYRKGGWLCVAAEDGIGERRVVESAAGAFSLSADGAVLAFVSAETATLGLADVATGRVAAVGPATQDPPSWAPDSTWLAYTAPGPTVHRVMRDGSGSSALFPGSLPAVSTDGSVVVGATVAGEVAVSRGGAVSRFSAGGTITGLACDGSTVYYGALDPPSAAVALRAAGLDGSRGRTIVGAAAASRAVTFGDLLLAPDGGELVYAEHGDDGYSRMFAVAAGGGVPVSLCVRRDCYPLRWAADGQSVLFIEGNAFQGDATALMRVAPSGQSRRLLVDGAGR